MTMYQEFATEYPDVIEWIGANPTFDFAVSLGQQAARKGYLSIPQIEAARRCAARSRPAQQSSDVDTGALEKVFARVNPVLRKPALNVGAYRFSPAPASGRNPGALYVKHDGEYLGKMLNGQFLARCSQEITDEVLAIAADPLGKAIEHGRLTGRCAICNRNLKDEDSTERGIGPVCAKRFGFELED